MDVNNGIEVNVIDWKSGRGMEVAVVFTEDGNMVTISPENARTLAFMLMQCADFISPPFGQPAPVLSYSSDETEPQIKYEYDDDDLYYESDYDDD